MCNNIDPVENGACNRIIAHDQTRLPLPPQPSRSQSFTVESTDVEAINV